MTYGCIALDLMLGGLQKGKLIIREKTVNNKIPPY